MNEPKEIDLKEAYERELKLNLALQQEVNGLRDQVRLLKHSIRTQDWLIEEYQRQLKRGYFREGECCEGI